jgi:transcriptional regulator with XRE-family HTH domain
MKEVLMKDHLPITTQTSYFEYLRDVRIANGMTLTQVSRASQIGDDEKTKVPLPVLSKIEHGKIRVPSITTVVKISRGYGIPLDTLKVFFL